MRVGEFRGYDVGVERLRRLGFEDVAKTLRQRVVGQVGLDNHGTTARLPRLLLPFQIQCTCVFL